MATRPHPNDNEHEDHITSEQRASIDRALADSAAGRSYRIGPEDLEEFIYLPEEEMQRFRESRESLDAWLAAHAAKYV